MKLLTLTFYLVLIVLGLTTPTLASDCKSLYENKDYEAALPFCIEESNHFIVGRIYSELRDCLNMRKHYLLSDSPSAKGNLGMNLLGGYRGCERNVTEGVQYLNEAISKGRTGFARILGDHYEAIGNLELAESNYRKAIEFTNYSSDWQKERASEAYYNLVKLLEYDEKKKFYLKDLNIEGKEIGSLPWERERAERAFLGLKGMLTTDDKLDLFLNTTLIKEQKCQIGENLYNQDFKSLMIKIKNENKKQMFIRNLCVGQREYFLGLTYENGLGSKEDFREAYRLYLIAGAKSNPSAKAARDRIRDKLSSDQIKQATCLADYGLEPNIFHKWRCDW